MKNILSVFCLTAGLAGAATTAQAQTSFSIGPRIGGNLSNVSFTSDTPTDVKPQQIFGVQVGATAEFRFGTNLAFQPSLIYTQKGFKTESTDSFTSSGGTSTSTSKQTLKVGYLEVPLNFVYTTGGDHGFQLFAGPYLALGVGGKATYESSYTIPGGITHQDSGTSAVKFANQEPSNSNNDDAYLRPLDAGFNGGLGYRQGPFQVQASYGLGLGNLVPTDSNGKDQGVKVRNRVIQLSANYFFGGK